MRASIRWVLEPEASCSSMLYRSAGCKAPLLLSWPPARSRYCLAIWRQRGGNGARVVQVWSLAALQVVTEPAQLCTGRPALGPRVQCPWALVGGVVLPNRCTRLDQSEILRWILPPSSPAHM